MTLAASGRREKVSVRLTDIDIEIRREIAERVIRQWKLRGVAALAMQFAADNPVQDPSITVDADKAYAVMVERKLPKGQIPRIA